MPVIENVETNVISGFLGSGKTTAILHLFTQKPDTEKWAVLVNEFGETGIDGEIYQSNGITVKEIPGGCMCCTQGLPLQVAVNRLLKATHPDRLIIESSGVGHPSGVLKTLSDTGFNNVLILKASICLLDPMHLLDDALLTNALFVEQLSCADILVANKTDLASIESLQLFQQLGENLETPKTFVTETIQGKIQKDWLSLKHHKRKAENLFPDKTVLTPTYQSHSQTFPAQTCFNLTRLKTWVNNLKPLRLKGILRTHKGYYHLNFSNGVLDCTPVENGSNAIQIIQPQLNRQRLSNELEECIMDQSG